MIVLETEVDMNSLSREERWSLRIRMIYREAIPDVGMMPKKNCKINFRIVWA